jgi:translocator protein
MKKPFSAGILAIFLLLPVLIGVTASFATASSVSSWYIELNKPFFNPPNWLFGPVWTLLYLMMGVSSWLVYRSPASASRTLSLDTYGFMLFLNFCWSFLFFGFQMPGLAFIEIVFLWAIIVAMIIQFGRVSRLAALLQIPYLIWVSFASVLNGSIWYLN